jgi:hypothetical protein
MATRKGSPRRAGKNKDDTTALKIRLRGKDNAPLSMAELREALLQAARELQVYEDGYRAKFSTLYLTMVDADGNPVRINEANELTIYPYRSAAEDHGL